MWCIAFYEEKKLDRLQGFDKRSITSKDIMASLSEAREDHMRQTRDPMAREDHSPDPLNRDNLYPLALFPDTIDHHQTPDPMDRDDHHWAPDSIDRDHHWTPDSIDPTDRDDHRQTLDRDGHMHQTPDPHDSHTGQISEPSDPHTHHSLEQATPIGVADDQYKAEDEVPRFEVFVDVELERSCCACFRPRNHSSAPSIRERTVEGGGLNNIGDNLQQVGPLRNAGHGLQNVGGTTTVGDDMRSSGQGLSKAGPLRGGLRGIVGLGKPRRPQDSLTMEDEREFLLKCDQLEMGRDED